MSFLKKLNCPHDYIVHKKSNVLQIDDAGYPLRLCICKCEKCGRFRQMWIDEPMAVLDEVDEGKAVLLKWL